MAQSLTRRLLKDFFKEVAAGGAEVAKFRRGEVADIEAAALKETRTDTRAKIKADAALAKEQRGRKATEKTERGRVDRAITERRFKIEAEQIKIRQKRTAAATTRTQELADVGQKQQFQTEERVAGQEFRTEQAAQKASGIRFGQIRREDLVDRFLKLPDSIRLTDFDGDFDAFVEFFTKNTGATVVDEIEEPAEAPSSQQPPPDQIGPPAPSSGAAGVDLFNSIVNRPVQPEIESPADTIPVGFPPIPGEEGIDITDTVDPDFHLDPERSPAAAFANDLLNRAKTGEITEEEADWLERYLEAVDL